MKNIADVLHSIQGLLASADAGERAHGASLTGPRTAGSTTLAGLDALPGDLPLETFTPGAGAIPCCTYYRTVGDIGALRGTLGAAPYAAVRAAGIVVAVRLGRHGPEMYVDVAPGSRQHGEILDAVGASAPLTLTVVMGPRETPGATGLIPWTWFPGEPLATTSDRGKRGPDGQLAFAFGDSTAEKVETLTPEVADLVRALALESPLLAVKLHNG